MAANDLALDLEELKHLQNIAKRPRVVSLISSEIRNLEKVFSTITFSLLVSLLLFLCLLLFDEWFLC